MKYHILLLCWFSFFACQSPQDNSSTPVTAHMVGAGIISNEMPEFATTVNQDETEMFFNRTNADRSRMQIMRSVKENGQWTAAQALHFSTGDYLDVDPFLTADGQQLYFSSDRPVGNGSDKEEELDTWYVERLDQGWSDPINAGSPLNSDSTEIFVSMSKHGHAYFVSERSDIRIIMRSKLGENGYEEAEPIELKLRGEVIYASNPAISSDESFLIVASRDPEGNGRPDLFVSWNDAGTWSEIINLGEAVNTPYAEFAPGLSKDDQTLYFSSERPGILPAQEEGVRPPGDIYQVDIQAVLESLQ